MDKALSRVCGGLEWDFLVVFCDYSGGGDACLSTSCFGVAEVASGESGSAFAEDEELLALARLAISMKSIQLLFSGI